MDILLKMINEKNIFARKESLHLLNAILREDYLKDIADTFASSVVST